MKRIPVLLEDTLKKREATRSITVKMVVKMTILVRKQEGYSDEEFHQ